MTLKKRIVLFIEMDSQCSEADLSEHLKYFCAKIVCGAKDAATHSWEQNVSVGWEESYLVEIRVKTEDLG